MIIILNEQYLKVIKRSKKFFKGKILSTHFAATEKADFLFGEYSVENKKEFSQLQKRTGQ